MTDVNGVVVWKADYTPFGVVTVNEDPDGDGVLVKNNFRLPGQYYDAETGLNYNYFRTYDPLVGRYTQSDPIGLRGGLNPFGYVNNDPVNSVDINGLFVLDVGFTGGKGKAGVNVGLQISNAGIAVYYGFGLGAGAGFSLTVGTGAISNGVSINTTARAGEGLGGFGSVSIDQNTGAVTANVGAGFGIGWGFSSTATKTMGMTWNELFGSKKSCP